MERNVRKQPAKATYRVGELFCKPHLISTCEVNIHMCKDTPLASKTTPKNPILKWGKHLNKHICKQDIQMDNRQTETCSTTLGLREMQVKTTMRCHLTFSEWLSLKRQKIISAGEAMEKKESCALLLAM